MSALFHCCIDTRCGGITTNSYFVVHLIICQAARSQNPESIISIAGSSTDGIKEVIAAVKLFFPGGYLVL